MSRTLGGLSAKLQLGWKAGRLYSFVPNARRWVDVFGLYAYYELYKMEFYFIDELQNFLWLKELKTC